MTRRFGPLALLVDGYLDLCNGPRAVGICGGYECTERVSQYWLIGHHGKDKNITGNYRIIYIYIYI